MTPTKHIGRKMGCPICKPPPAKAKIYVKERLFLITRCGKCKVPMVVVHSHKREEDFTKKELQEVIDRCSYVASVAYPNYHFTIDRKTQHWPDHMHWHIRQAEHVDGDMEEME